MKEHVVDNVSNRNKFRFVGHKMYSVIAMWLLTSVESNRTMFFFLAVVMFLFDSIEKVRCRSAGKDLFIK